MAPPERTRKLDDPTMPHAAAPPPPLERGTPIGRYVTLDLIGAGAMGVVYAAHDPELDRKVALKVLRTDRLGDEGSVRVRLQREAQALARLTHPNVIIVHDVGTCAQGVFIAMELVDGGTLAQWIRKPHDWREVIAVFHRAGEGLAAAHRAGLVHRDFKPDNVLVGNDGRVRVTDFGLARMAGPNEGAHEIAPESPLRASLTRTGALQGTPAYMAPEQMSGGTVDARADIFSFCVSLYEGLYRQRPFAGGSLEALQKAMVANDVREPPKSDVPDAVRRAVFRGLRAAPGERPATMDELLKILDEASRPGQPRSRRGLLAIGGAALVAVVATALFALKPATKPAVAPASPTAPPAMAPRTVELRLTSRPAGAAVFRFSDGIQIGTTPLTKTLPAISGVMRLVLKLPGYVDEEVEVPADRDSEREVVLKPQPTVRATPMRKPAKPPVKLDDPFQ